MRQISFVCVSLLLCLSSGCVTRLEPAAPEPFAIAVIPDTQNYLDYRHQVEQCFALDGKSLLLH